MTPEQDKTLKLILALPPSEDAENAEKFLPVFAPWPLEKLKKAIAHARNGAKSAELPIRNLTEYLNDIDENPPSIIDGLIFRQAAHQLMGTVKAGKTTFLISLVDTVLHGKKFLSCQCTPTTILYVTEQPRFSFQTQLRDAGIELPEGDGAPSLYILDLKDIGMLDWPGRAQAIRAVAKKVGAGLVIIDTFIRIAMIEDIASAGEANSAFEKISPIVVEDGCGLILGWHERKSGGTIIDAAQGSVAGAGAVDQLMRLTRVPGQKFNSYLRMIETRGRMQSAFEEPSAIELSADKTSYKIIGTGFKAQGDAATKLIQNLLPNEPPGITFSDLVRLIKDFAEAENFKPPSRSTVQRQFDALVEKGAVLVTGERGKEGGKNAKIAKFYRA